MVRRYWFIAVTSVLAAAVILGIGYQFWWGYTRLPVVDRAPDFTLSNLAGKQVKLHDSDGKVRLVSFFYSHCPDICQATNVNLARIQQKLNEEKLLNNKAVILSITFDPQIDTPQVLHKYADQRNIHFNGWEFLRGTPEQTKNVLTGFKVVAEKQSADLFIHSNQMFLLDKDENIRAVYKMGSEMDNNKILADIKNLAHET
ncbi:SCO family protein [Aneurinibacillus terranovensis]|uniref:SCO family protein n=1 Tax=Aneurinibacillus terranovensis TaxID=278991 RepID=UPI000414FD35|nr:SCO family protein [Aneurinibacillus terranovensis]